MSVSIAEICENTKLAREAALLGNYETAGVYYQGVVQQIHRLLATISDPVHKGKWQSVIVQFKIKFFSVIDQVFILSRHSNSWLMNMNNYEAFKVHSTFSNLTIIMIGLLAQFPVLCMMSHHMILMFGAHHSPGILMFGLRPPLQNTGNKL